MTNTVEVFRAGIDAVFANNALTGMEFNDAMRTVITNNFSNQEAADWRDAIATEYNRLGLINNPTYSSLRNQGILNAPTEQDAEELFSALSGVINAIPETSPVASAARLQDLRAERDTIDGALDRFDVLIAAEPNGVQGRLIREDMRLAKGELRQLKERVRTEIQNIIGDPDG